MGLLDGLFNLGSTIIGNRANRQNVQDTNQANIDLWREQSAYNTPANQMQRFKDAGLNPNLMYGQGNGGNAASPPSQIAPHVESPTINLPETMNVLNQYLQSKLLGEELAKKQYETGITKENYIRNYMTNDIDFGYDRGTPTAFGKGSFGIVQMNSGKPTRFEQLKNFELSDKAYGNKILEVNANSAKEVKDKYIFALEQLGRIRQQEGNMNESLKEWNINAQDPFIARLLARALEGTKWASYLKR